MRKVAVMSLLLGAISGCRLDELLWPTPPCPKIVVYDTLGWMKILNSNRTVRDSLPVTGNQREVCNPNRRFTGAVK